MKHSKHTPIRDFFERVYEKISEKFAAIVDKIDDSHNESEAFRNGDYCNERKVFLKEIRIMKALLCIDLVCTLALAWIMVA